MGARARVYVRAHARPRVRALHMLHMAGKPAPLLAFLPVRSLHKPFHTLHMLHTPRPGMRKRPAHGVPKKREERCEIGDDHDDFHAASFSVNDSTQPLSHSLSTLSSGFRSALTMNIVACFWPAIHFTAFGTNRSISRENSP